MKTKVDIISGFLGAGKTTLINELLKNIECKKDIVLIENEFGDIGIDGSFIKNSDINIKEINSGCICCSVANDFYNGIITIIDKYKPRRIIIEPSGVSKLSEIISICTKNRLRDLIEVDSIITVVDGIKFNLYLTNFSEFYIDQIKNAKSIFVSRKDILGLEIEKVIKQINSLNKNASIISNVEDLHKEIIDKDKKYIEGKYKPIVENKISSNKEINEKIMINKDSRVILKNKNFKVANKVTINKTKATFQSIGIKTEKIFLKSELNRIIEKANEYGEILRIKGFVKFTDESFLQFNFVPKELGINVVDYRGIGKVSIIGQNLDKKGLEDLFS